LVLFYWFRSWRAGQEFNNSVMINAILQASGIICGLFLVSGTFVEEIKTIVSGIDIYVLVGGLAVLAVSVQGVHRDIIKPTRLVKESREKL